MWLYSGGQVAAVDIVLLVPCYVYVNYRMNGENGVVMGHHTSSGYRRDHCARGKMFISDNTAVAGIHYYYEPMTSYPAVRL